MSKHLALNTFDSPPTSHSMDLMGDLYFYETSIFYSLDTNTTRSTQLKREAEQQIVLHMRKHSNHIES